MGRSDIALQAIGEMLIQAFEDTVDQPLPPLILRLMRQLVNLDFHAIRAGAYPRVMGSWNEVRQLDGTLRCRTPC
jgi:hypothetical protein